MDFKFSIPIFCNKVFVIIDDDKSRVAEYARKIIGQSEVSDPQDQAYVISDGMRHVVWFSNILLKMNPDSLDLLTHETRHLADDVLTSVGVKIRSGGECEAYMQGYLAKEILRRVTLEQRKGTR